MGEINGELMKNSKSLFMALVSELDNKSRMVFLGIMLAIALKWAWDFAVRSCYCKGINHENGLDSTNQ